MREAGTEKEIQVKFAREPLTPGLLDELAPLNAAHWEEIAHWKDIKLKVDRARYLAMEQAGATRTYTVRDESSKLVGYAVFFLVYNAHYADSYQALQDVIFLLPEYRKHYFGARFIDWCDTQLRGEGAQLSMHHVKVAHNFGPLLERLGYELVDLIYARRLDKETVK